MTIKVQGVLKVAYPIHCVWYSQPKKKSIGVFE
jgi:hypothetical protein